MQKDHYILIIFFTLLLVGIVKTATLTYEPMTMGMLAILFFVAVMAFASRK